MANPTDDLELRENLFIAASNSYEMAARLAARRVKEQKQHSTDTTQQEA
jgi:hypothetical protein